MSYIKKEIKARDREVVDESDNLFISRDFENS